MDDLLKKPIFLFNAFKNILDKYDFTKNDKKHAQLIKDLTAKRLATLQTLSSWSWAGKAWTRRLYEIQDAGLKYITENPVKTGGAVVGLLLLGAGAYFLSKGGFTKIVG